MIHDRGNGATDGMIGWQGACNRLQIAPFSRQDGCRRKMEAKHPTELEQFKIIDAFHILEACRAVLHDRLNNFRLPGRQIDKVLKNGCIVGCVLSITIGKHLPDVQLVGIPNQAHENLRIGWMAIGKRGCIMKPDGIDDDLLFIVRQGIQDLGMG